MTLRGMTWDHPRAYLPLRAFAGRPGAPAVTWDRQSLADFEARPIDELARAYDLLIIDHPGLGSAIATGALTPLADLVDAATLGRWRAESVGPTWGSYTVDGGQWAVPIDAATQVSVLRPDLVDRAPRSWAGAVELARARRTALCLGGPHALLCLLAMCASAGASAGSGAGRGAGAGDGEHGGGEHGHGEHGHGEHGGDLLAVGPAIRAIELLRGLWRHVDRQVSLGDPIAVHEALAAGPDLAYCPLAYGYASYARPEPGRAALRWSDAPGFGSDRPGTVLGGTGLAVSARSGADPAEVRAFLAAFLAAGVQTELVPAHAGQPAHRGAWDSPTVDARWGRYYSSTRRSIEAAWRRPRRPGWIALQEQASGLIREAVTGPSDPAAAIRWINQRYRALAGGQPAEASTT